MKIYIIYELFLCLLVVTFCPPGGFMLTVDGRASSGSGSATVPATLWVILRPLSHSPYRLLCPVGVADTSWGAIQITG